ncbi:hypothetical protein [Thiocystis violascens]|uniref:Uncharacterized protein n=1 Tax=Thiocystis violascens (strain ATCC 17096 / DSM 198 / 6111) TaxID=765911 RepID=I3YFV4_THIV6|nr:hypothetical protein [Thiocystis violascens]AFL75872.1 hypothetical protein Thivi_4048 [Thiocystis violascens DSM 198]
MIHVQHDGDMTSGAFLGFAGFDYIYHLVALAVVTDFLIDVRLPDFPFVLSPELVEGSKDDRKIALRGRHCIRSWFDKLTTNGCNVTTNGCNVTTNGCNVTTNGCNVIESLNCNRSYETYG